ncbi:hypothetical protein M0Q50_03735 [bacterium]|jgi:hypothetical protein|nr:hypothetical protein [bacterium]
MKHLKLFGEHINESISNLLKMGIEPSKDKPSIFQYTIYRLPTEEELDEFINYPNMTPEQIVNGFGYTIIGRGMNSEKNQNMIKQCIQLLIDKYPKDDKYKHALKLTNKN